MIIEQDFKNYGIQNVVAYSGKDINENLIDRCFKLDEVFYREQFKWDDTSIKETILANPEMCFVFIDKVKGSVVGYSYWFPIKTEVLDKFVREENPLLDIKKEYCTGYKSSPINLFLGGQAFVPGYDMAELHKAIEDIFQKHILFLAQNGIMVDTVSFDSVCSYDELYLVPRCGLTNRVEKKDCYYYFGKYNPKEFYRNSKYAQKLKEFYK